MRRASVAQRKYSDCKSANDLREKLSSEGFSIFFMAGWAGRVLQPA